MRKILAALLALILLFSLASCGNSEEKAEKYIESAAGYADNEDYENAIRIVKEGVKIFPQNEKLKSYLEELETLYAEQNEVATEETVKAKFLELVKQYNIWFQEPYENLNISSEAYREGTYSERLGTSWTFSYVVTDEKIKSKSDLDKMFLRYCSEELYSKMSLPLGYYEDIDDNLCLTTTEGGGSGIRVDEETIKVTKNTNDDFVVMFLVIRSADSSRTAEWGTLHYSKGEKGGCKFRNYSETEAEKSIESGEYTVNISEGELAAYELPRLTSSKVGAFKNKDAVHIVTSIDGWAYAESDTTCGWIEISNLKSAAEEQSDSGRRSGGYSSYGNAAAEIVGGAVDAGVYVAGKILNRIF